MSGFASPPASPTVYTGPREGEFARGAKTLRSCDTDNTGVPGRLDPSIREITVIRGMLGTSSGPFQRIRDAAKTKVNRPAGGTSGDYAGGSSVSVALKRAKPLLADRPFNGLEVIADQHHAELMGCMGHAQALSPHFDALAAGAMRFTNA